MENEETDSDNSQLQELLKYGTDLTKMAAEGKLDPLIGRDKEIERVIEILCKRRKNNACLIGDPGVGKTVIIEGLAVLLSNGSVQKQLIGKKIFALDMGRIIAGGSHGKYEERLKNIVDEVIASNGNIILFIDELHTLIDEDSGSHNILKPALARGQLRCIGATTVEEYKIHIEKDAALKRRFVSVQVLEPSIDEAIEILMGVRNKYETFHNVEYEEEAIISCVVLSHKYLNEQHLPDKAFDLMDEAGSRAQVTPKTVTRNDVGRLISSITGIPEEQICGDHEQESAKRMLSLEKILSKHVIGQEEAISTISRAIRRARVGLRDFQRPIAAFLFTGPTGVGKTETAKVLAREYFGGRINSMVRLDMSEYIEPHSVSKLIGSPPGYYDHEQGGQLTEAIRRTPHALILLDEIEKAHPKILNVFLQVFDDGRLTDTKGRTVDFKNTIIIMTSNVVIDEDDVNASAKLKRTFKPEFLNRLDEIVIFKKLNSTNLQKIMEEMVRKVVERININNKLKVEVSEKFKEKLLEESRSLTYGARPLKRAIARLFEDNLAESILNGTIIKNGDPVLVDVDNSGKVIVENKQHRNTKESRKSIVTKIAMADPDSQGSLVTGLVNLARGLSLSLSSGVQAIRPHSVLAYLILVLFVGVWLHRMTI